VFGRVWVRSVGVPAVVAVAAFAAAGDARGDEWPRLWGPRGDAQAAQPAAPPGTALTLKELWRRPLGSGFSGIAVVAGRGFTGETDGTDDHVLAFDLETGRTLWRSRLGSTYRGHDGSKDGPIATPAVQAGRVFVTGPRGGLFAFDASSGGLLWQHDLTTELGANLPFYGFGTSPTPAGDRVVVQVGGVQKHGLVAFDAASGRVVWAVDHGNSAGYSTPLVTSLAGVPQLVVVGHESVYAVRPEDGALLWSHKLGESEEPSRPPIALDGSRVLVPRWSSSILIEVTREGETLGAVERWRSARFKGSYSPGVLHEGHLFGFNAQYLTCLDPASGEVKWRHKANAGALVLVGRHLLVLGEQSGLLRVVEATPEGYRQVAELAAFNAGAASFTHPSIAGGRAYLRNTEELLAVELSVGPRATPQASAP
jgi:outer membrane protein assembly factor BamB